MTKSSDSARPSVIVAEPRWKARGELARAFKAAGRGVIEAVDSNALWAALARALERDDGSADRVASSARMPRQDGPTVLLRLRALDVITPFILLTTLEEAHHELLAFRPGASTAFTRPFDLAALLRAGLQRVRGAI